MEFRLNEAAESEFYEIVEYFSQIDPDLANDFIGEFELAVQHILKFPKAGHPYLYQTKRVFLSRFPYAIVYRESSASQIEAFAIMHLRRKPDYWIK